MLGDIGRHLGFATLVLLFGAQHRCYRASAAEPIAAATESAAEATQRHERVAARRAQVHLICHRGASEFAHENTLEAYRASFELGADGNEIDIRATQDGILVCFHDDMLDQLLVAYGDVSDYRWEELQRFAFRKPGPFGAAQCRIPTLVEVLELHRKYGGLIHLDIKRPHLDQAVAQLLDRFDMWDQVAYCNAETGGVILKDPRLKLCRYKAGLYQDHSEVFSEAISAALQKPGEGLIVDDPRGAIVALGRKLGSVSKAPVTPQSPISVEEVKPRSEAELIAALRDAADWNMIAESEATRLAAGRRVIARAQAAGQLGMMKSASAEAFAALEERVRERSLHKDWRYHGVDGASALRSLILLKAPSAIDVARFALWRDDALLAAVADPRFANPRAWTDFRVKAVAFPTLAHLPGKRTEQLCRDYLALDDEVAGVLGPPLFEEAGRALLAVSPTTDTALELMQHRLQVVRGRAILDCLAHSQEPWARSALETGAKPALAYLIGP